MNISEIHSFLDSFESATPWLDNLGVQDPGQAYDSFIELLHAGFTVDLLSTISDQLESLLPDTIDPDMALDNLRRFVLASRSPIALGGLFERDLTALPILLKIFSSSRYLSDLLINDPEAYDLLRLTDGMPIARRELVDELAREIQRNGVQKTDSAIAILRRFQHRELLRIAYGDLVRLQPVETVASQLSYVADAVCNAALAFSLQYVKRKRGEVFGERGENTPLAIIALGGLGGNELDYNGSIELLFVHSRITVKNEKQTLARQQFIEQVAHKVIELISIGDSKRAIADRLYDVSVCPCADGNAGPLVGQLENVVNYFEQSGSVSQRQAFIKARVVSGSEDVGDAFLARLRSWVYPPYLSRADISGMRFLRRTVLKRLARTPSNDIATDEADADYADHLLRHLDRIQIVELCIGFLQLSLAPNAADADARCGNTLDSIEQLHRLQILNQRESDILREVYQSLKLADHRQQILGEFRSQSKHIDRGFMNRLARLCGHSTSDGRQAEEYFLRDLHEQCQKLRAVLEHLLGEPSLSVPENTAVSPSVTTASAISPSSGDDVVDLLLDSDPDPDRIERTLADCRFVDAQAAWRNLGELSREKFRFLSTRRCRHFLANVLPGLLKEIAETPGPDETLEHLASVSHSLGGKGLLWELFSVQPIAMKLFVRLCASTRYLTGILNNNPGMIDELMDSLMVDALPRRDAIFAEFEELTTGAENALLVMLGIRNSNHLKVGVRDILGRDDIRDTHRTLADIAEACVECVARQELNERIRKHGTPVLESGEPCELIMLAMGKLGGREPNYHSDLDVVFLFEGDGSTQPESGPRQREARKPVSNDDFFNRLSARISQVINSSDAGVRLYELDSRLRPSGSSGPRALSLDAFLRYFRDGRAQTWERLALCKARPLFCSAPLREQVSQVIREAIVSRPLDADFAGEVRAIRGGLQADASEHNLKRGEGGTLDVEFAMQYLQVVHLVEHPQVLVSGTLDAIDQLHDAGLIRSEDQAGLRDAYRFLREIESRLRLLDLDGRHDLPDDQAALEKLAYLMNFDSIEQLCRTCDDHRRANRERFLRIVSS